MTKEQENYVEILKTYIESLELFISQQTKRVEDNNWEIGLMRESIKQAEKRKKQALADIQLYENKKQ